ncbi:MAG: M42 family metallopeptidase [Syntrophobacteraceae bacterium]
MDETAQLLKDLSEAHGVPGYENEIRALVRRLLEPFGAIDQDRVGSLVCRNGETGPRLMLAAHLDEIGFMVSHITDDGFLRFLPLGGWWEQVLLGQRVLIKTHRGDLPGVIGAKPPHVLSQEERKKLVELRGMYIDIGAASKAQVEEAGVRLGDPVVPDSPFLPLLGGKVYMGKAFDDRVGLALMIDTMRHFSRASHPNVLCATGTVMEEVGLRGAKTSAGLVDPDAAIILESDICGDVPGIEPHESSIKLGGGPSLVLLEARMIPNLKFRDLAIETAAQLGIPLQYSAWLGGSTDGGQIHLHGIGVPTIVLGVPARHIHCHSGFISREDYDRTLRLLIALVEKLDAKTVAGFTGRD